MSLNCAVCGANFEVPAAAAAVMRKMSLRCADGRELPIPAPRCCPECRKRRRLSFRNDFALYRRRCDRSGRDLISIYPDSAPFPVYSYSEWWGDGWDALEYGAQFDFNRPFFEQFRELRDRVPRLAVYVDNLCENSEFCNQITMSKNCYFLFSGSGNEGCCYCYRCNGSRDCADCLYCIDSELCYECVDLTRSYGCRYSQIISGCSESAFLYDCQECRRCLHCVGLRSADLHIRNRPVTIAEYRAELQRINGASRADVEAMRSELAQMIAMFPRKHLQLLRCENTLGDNVQNSRNSSWVFDCANIEDVHFGQFVQDSKDCVDVNYLCDNTELHYEVATGGINAYRVAFCVDTWPTVSNLLYCDSCSNGTRDCFGCVGLRAKRFCILNRQYTQVEYERLLPQIIDHLLTTGEWGEFFPQQISPFGYDESTAFDLLPLNQEQAVALGFRWRGADKREYRPATAAVPSRLSETALSAVNELYACRGCSRNFRITTAELNLYRKLEVPPPDRCFQCRHRARVKQRNPARLWERACTRCGVELYSTYAPDGAALIHCEECYLRERERTGS